MSNTFVINGKTYHSLEEMPPDVRAQWDSMHDMFEDKNQNGLPDIVDTMNVQGATMIQTNTIVYDGKVYGSADELPPEGRAAYQAAMEKLADNDRDGVPDIAQNPAPPVSTTQVSFAAAHPALPPAATTNLGPIIVLAIVGIGLAIILGILFFLVLNRP